MAQVTDIVREARDSPGTVRFRDLVKVCDAYFGAPRQAGTSHRVYRTPWPGDPRVNVQNHNGMAKQSAQQTVKHKMLWSRVSGFFEKWEYHVDAVAVRPARAECVKRPT